ncbi:unnamed protein product [Owenia fusiformis]|uniref:Uncharacterized protein n=1 Tax=Owenia fusiformis TaxID=6347 RepID=A0A8S4Q554_OWEFU|nr:unnamed protein product [Owenia fusiformis]
MWTSPKNHLDLSRQHTIQLKTHKSCIIFQYQRLNHHEDNIDVSHFGLRVCAPVCHKVCNIGRKRRSVVNNEDELPFSSDFFKYDVNYDDVITLTEFADAIDSTPDECIDVFGTTDQNNDGVLDMSEFMNGPFRFSSE